MEPRWEDENPSQNRKRLIAGLRSGGTGHWLLANQKGFGISWMSGHEDLSRPPFLTAACPV